MRLSVELVRGATRLLEAGYAAEEGFARMLDIVMAAAQEEFVWERVK